MFIYAKTGQDIPQDFPPLDAESQKDEKMHFYGLEQTQPLANRIVESLTATFRISFFLLSLKIALFFFKAWEDSSVQLDHGWEMTTTVVTRVSVRTERGH